MKIRFYFIAWMLCSIVGGIARIMHFSSLVSTISGSIANFERDLFGQTIYWDSFCKALS